MAKTITVAVLLVAVPMWAAQSVALSLPPVEKADAEVVTNVPLPALSRRAGHVKCKVKNGECKMTVWEEVGILHSPFSILHSDDVQGESFSVQFLFESFTVILR